MLITNFASGELSETLFGRIDLAQYYSSAARIENFDVIPTGGIKRRSGMEQLGYLIIGGRLIPFHVNRDLCFLLYLAAGGIHISKVKNVIEDGINKTIITPDGMYLHGYQAEEVDEVQYAQNFDTMILCHENYPPLEVRLEDEEEKLSIQPLKISFKKEVLSGENITDNDVFPYKKDDEIYAEEGWLVKKDHYPTAVNFFNGRIVFAATKKKRQRLFISAAKKTGEYYNFATKKVILTEKKEYIVIHGTIEKDNPDTIFIENNDGLKFVSRLEDYIIDTPYYEKDTRIYTVHGNIIKMTKGAVIGSLTPEINNEIEAMRLFAENKDSFPTSNQILLAQYEYRTFDHPIYGTPQYDNATVYITPGATKFRLTIIRERSNNSQLDIELTPNAVYQYENNSQYYDNFIREKILMPLLFTGGSDHATSSDNFPIVVENLKNNSLQTMKYNLVAGRINEVYYNYPWEIKTIVERRFEEANKIYIPFYTREIISDEYPTPDCGFTFEIASDASDAIRWLAVNRGLIVGTEMGEWVIPPDVHATNHRAVPTSRYGSDRIQGTAVGDATIFLKSGRKGIVEYYPNEYDHFRAKNMAILAPQMLHESPAKEFEFATEPYTRLLITREDGKIAALLYERMAGAFGWSRISTMGKVRSCAVLPGPDGFDDIYLVTERNNGAFFLERLREAGAVYLDCWQEWIWETDAEREALLAAYGETAVIYDVKENKTYKPFEKPAETKPPDIGNWTLGSTGKYWKHGKNAATGRQAIIYWNPKKDLYPPASDADNPRYIGFPYASVMKSMPVVNDGTMRPVRMTTLYARFHDSYMPTVWGVSSTDKTPINGVAKIVNPHSGPSQTYQFDIVHNEPNRCCVLSVCGEV